MDILQAYKMVQDRPTIDELAKQTEILVTFFRQLPKNTALEEKRIRANQPIEHMKVEFRVNVLNMVMD